MECPGSSDNEEMEEVKDQLLALLQNHEAAVSLDDDDDDDTTERACQVLLQSIQAEKQPTQFIRTSMTYNNKSVRTLLGNLPSATTGKIAPLLTSLISDRVELAHVLPATQDDEANEQAMSSDAITLTKQGFLAAELYVELIGMPGAWGAGLINVGTLSALSALLRRWRLECCGSSTEKDTVKKKRKPSQSRAPPTKRSSASTLVFDSESDDTQDEESDEEYSFCVKEESPLLSYNQLVTGGLKVGQALGKATLGNEFVTWSTEAREAFIDTVITCLLTTAALDSFKDSQLYSSVMTALPKTLERSLLSIDTTDDSNDDSDQLDSNIKREEANHETCVSILRGLFPSLAMQTELPNGHKGKEAACKVAISTLQGITTYVAISYETSVARATPSTTTTKTPRATLPPTTPGSSMIPTTTPATCRTGRKKRVSFGGLDETKKPAPPTLKRASTPARSRVVGTPTTTEGGNTPRPILSAILGLLQKLATQKQMDRAHVRTHSAEILLQMLPSLPKLERGRFLQFLIRLCHSKLAVHRLLCVELVSKILGESWLWKNFSESSPATSPTAGTLLPVTPSTRSSFSPIVECSTGNMPLALLRVIQGRLVDRAPAVRARAAHCFGELLQNISAGETELLASSLQVVASGFARSLSKRASLDTGATVRKAAIGALVELLVFDDTCQLLCSEADIHMLSHLCADPSVAVRKAAADALTSLLSHFCSKDGTRSREVMYALEEAWPTSILPLVLDTEPTCVTKSVNLFYDTIIEPLVSAHGEETELQEKYALAWRLLARVSDRSFQDGAARGEFGALKIIVGKLADSYNDEVIQHLLPHVRDTIIGVIEEDEDGSLAFSTDAKLEAQLKGAWCLLEAVADQDKELPGLGRLVKRKSFQLDFLTSSWETMFKSESSDTVQLARKSCMSVLSKWAKYVTLNDAQTLTEKLKDWLCTFQLSTALVGRTVSALVALTSRVCGNPDETKQECAAWIKNMYKNCEATISSFVSGPAFFDATTLVRALFVAGELSTVGFRVDEGHLSNGQVDKHQADAAQDPVAGLNEPPSNRLLNLVQTLLSKLLPGGDPTPEAVRAQAFLALGKFCLRNESLAKKSLTILARELHQRETDACPAVQSNALLVLGDLFVRYTNLVDRYLPVVSACMNSMEDRTSLFGTSDNSTSLVRKHAVLLLSSLLLQDYIKWRGLLFQRFLVASTDRDEGVARLAEMTLCGPLLAKYPKLFFNNFVESLFVLNRCTAHPIYSAAASAGDNGGGITVGFDGINLTGAAGRAEREHMYGTLLANMSDEEKIGITARLANDVLGAALQTDGDLARVCRNPNLASARDENAFNVLSDALSILSSPALQVGKSATRDDAAEEMDNSLENRAQHVAVAKGRLLSKISRKQLVEIVLPILCNLKTTLQESCSPLLKELMRYMVTIFQAYKVEVKEFLANDPTLLQEIEYDARQFKKQQRMESLSGLVVVSTAD